MRYRSRLRRPERQLKRLAPLLLFALLGVVLAVVFFQLKDPLGKHTVELVARTIDARVQKLPVSGAVFVDKTALQHAIGLQAGDSLVGYDVAAARKRLEALPWVRLAAVERRLPHTLAVELYEHVPLARVALVDDEWVIDKSGHQIAPTDARFAHLPLVQGDGAADEAAALFALLQGFPLIHQQLVAATWVGKRRWDLALQSGVTLQLPQEAPDEALETVLLLNERRNVLDVTAGEVDLRLNDRVVLRIPPGASPVPPGVE